MCAFNTLPLCRAGLYSAFPLYSSQSLRCTRHFASLALKYTADIQLLIPYKVLHGNKTFLRCNRCAAVDTAEIAQKRRNVNHQNPQ